MYIMQKKIIKTKIQVVYSERGLESCWLHNIFAVFVLLSIDTSFVTTTRSYSRQRNIF